MFPVTRPPQSSPSGPLACHLSSPPRPPVTSLSRLMRHNIFSLCHSSPFSYPSLNILHPPRPFPGPSPPRHRRHPRHLLFPVRPPPHPLPLRSRRGLLGLVRPLHLDRKHPQEVLLRLLLEGCQVLHVQLLQDRGSQGVQIQIGARVPLVRGGEAREHRGRVRPTQAEQRHGDPRAAPGVLGLEGRSTKRDEEV